MENGAETADEGVIALIAGAGGQNPARARVVLLALRDAGVLAVPPDEPLVPLSRENPKVDGIAPDGDQAGYTPARATGPCTCISPTGPDGVRTIARFGTDEGATFYLVAGAWTDHLLPARVRRSYDDVGGRPDFTSCGDGTAARGLFDAVAVRVVFSAVGGARHFARARLALSHMWTAPSPQGVVQ